MNTVANYDKTPTITVSSDPSECALGWDEVADRLRGFLPAGRCVLCIETYPGVFEREIEQALARRLRPVQILRSQCCYKPSAEINQIAAPFLTDDPVFGRMSYLELTDYIDPNRLAAARQTVSEWSRGLLLVIGTGAAVISPNADVLVYADLARWEIQQRQRRGQISSLGVNDAGAKPSVLYKRGFFLDWRLADNLKRALLPRINFLLDTNDMRTPKIISGEALHRALRKTVERPFRLVPFFDPGPWGGQWIRKVCALNGDAPNYAWCFDCVPEENSLLLGFGNRRMEIPAVDLVFTHPRELLGDAVHARFGAEFPIRFDFLDTMDGGNLSLQVHPTTEYIRSHFGLYYTQDESYYILDADQGAAVYLGLKDEVNPESMLRDLELAENPDCAFPADRYVNQFPAHKHDHFLIPAGTVHCSGRNCMVLEISATPYIFTFKLWDWGRLGLDGEPRPIHIDHGKRNIQWDRRTRWVKGNLLNQIQPLSSGEGWLEERTGLHEMEFIETRRCWFTGKIIHHTRGGVNVLNLVEGDEAVVESPGHAFEPFVVHYAETFVVPAAVGPYTITPFGSAQGKRCATIKAFVRTSA
ncbi:MAG TPA: class I mannose-6-phosphate isomerase [Terriglobia bacterium]|nr:class I mannose-6-phosphate isomerase [Terriglobia bacterium]